MVLRQCLLLLLGDDLLLCHPPRLEDLVQALGGELISQPRCLLAADLPVVLATHLVGDAVALRPGHANALLAQELLERLPVHAAFVHQHVLDRVAQRLLEATVGVLLATQLPLGLGPLGRFQYATPLLAHQLVVQLVQPVLPRGEALQRLAGEVVVIHHVDVVVQVTTERICVSDHEVIS